MTTVEAEWDTEQQAQVLALAAYRAQLCPGCGGYLPDTTDPQRALDGYEVDLPHRCGQCTALGRATPAYHESEVPHALHFTVKPRPTATAGS